MGARPARPRWRPDLIADWSGRRGARDRRADGRHDPGRTAWARHSPRSSAACSADEEIDALRSWASTRSTTWCCRGCSRCCWWRRCSGPLRRWSAAAGLGGGAGYGLRRRILLPALQAVTLPACLIGLFKGTVYRVLVALAGCRQGCHAAAAPRPWATPRPARGAGPRLDRRRRQPDDDGVAEPRAVTHAADPSVAPLVRVRRPDDDARRHRDPARPGLRHPRRRGAVVVGPSGCGKSTLLRHLIGLQQAAPRAGVVRRARPAARRCAPPPRRCGGASA